LLIDLTSTWVGERFIGGVFADHRSDSCADNQVQTAEKLTRVFEYFSRCCLNGIGGVRRHRHRTVRLSKY
jgi:hypothetical protein